MDEAENEAARQKLLPK